MSGPGMSDPGMSDSGRRKSGSSRSAARLAAVQALYQLMMERDTKPDCVIKEFIDHRFGQIVDGDRYTEADASLFADIVKDVSIQKTMLDGLIEERLTEKWSLERLDRVLLAILRAGVYELKCRPDIPPAVVINEYVEVTKAFFDQSESAFVNSLLDGLSKDLKTG